MSPAINGKLMRRKEHDSRRGYDPDIGAFAELAVFPPARSTPTPYDARHVKKTALESRLSPNDRDALGKKCQKWVRHLEQAQESRWKQQDIYRRQAQDDFGWRIAQAGTPEQPKDIFALQNDSLNIVGGYAEFMRARTIDDILGSEPFFSLIPQGGETDKALAEAMQKHGEWRVRRSTVQKAFRDAIESAYEIGEGVIKITYEQKLDYRETTQEILVDEAGNPVLDQDGGFITPTANSPTGEETPPAGASYKEMYVEETQKIGEPLQARLLHYRDFLCPPNVATLEDAPFLAHICQKRLSEIRRIYSPDKETINRLSQDSTAPKTAEKKPETEKESLFSDPGCNDSSQDDPVIRLAECYLIEQTPKGESRQMVVVAIDAGIVIAADYAANVTPDGAIPFFAVKAFPVRGRWYGRGYFEIFAMAQDFIDRHLDYVAYRNRYHSDPLKFVRPDCIDGLDATEEFPLQPGKALYLAPNKSGKDALEILVLPDLDERTWQLMQTMVQMLGLRSGISSAAQGGVSSVPQSNTATGVEAILSSGNLLSKPPINAIRQDLQAALFYALKLVYANFDEAEAFTYLEGNKATFLRLSPEQIAGLDFDIHLLLSRFRQRQQRENAETAIAAIEKYSAFPEIDKDAVRPFFIDVIQSLGFDNPAQSLRKAIIEEAPPQAPPPL